MKGDRIHNQNYKNATLPTLTLYVRVGSVSVEFGCFLFTMQMKNLCGVWIFDSRVWRVEQNFFCVWVRVRSVECGIKNLHCKQVSEECGVRVGSVE